VSELNAYERLRCDVLAEVKDRSLDPADHSVVARLIDDVVARYQATSRTGLGGRPLADQADMIARLRRSLLAWGPLTELLACDDIEEVFIRGGDVTYIDGHGRLASIDEPVTEDELRSIVDRLLATSGASIDETKAFTQATVLDGRVRLGVVIPPVADCLDATLRKYVARRETLAELVALDTLTRPAAELLDAAMKAKTGILASGQPGSGKTTLLNALMRAIPSNHRVLCCEDVRELSAPIRHGNYYLTRPAGPDGHGEVSLRDLVRMVLGMRPDWICVGEVRGSEAYELTRAGNAGTGLLCSLHANSAADALQALVSTAIMAGANVPAPVVRQIFSSTIDLVVHLDREDVQYKRDQTRIRRRVMQIVAVPPMQGAEVEFTVEPIFTRTHFDAPLRPTGAPLPDVLHERLDRVLRAHGSSVTDVLEGRPVPA
jgi:pilus assembly protein CpaF